MESGARFSKDRRYRYALWRIWDRSKEAVLFIGLNPSQADEVKDDPTIKRCIAFAKSGGFGSLYVVNLFAFCTAYPNELKQINEPIGQRNNYWIYYYKKRTNCHVAIWGNHGILFNRDQFIRRKYSKLYCLDKNKNGQPKHPLYIQADQKLQVLT